MSSSSIMKHLAILFCLTSVSSNVITEVLNSGHKFILKKSENITEEIVWSPLDPPPVDDAARMARYIVHKSEWCSVSHKSLQKDTFGYPMSRIFSVSDGPVDHSSGVPYIYTTMMDEGSRDMIKDNRCSMTMTLQQNDYCRKKNLDTEDPRCPQVILTGNFIQIKNNTKDWKLAEEALFTRHPAMRSWPKSHNFFFGKLKIMHILLVDNIGGNKYPSVEDYFNSPPPIDEDTPKYLTRRNSILEVDLV